MFIRFVSGEIDESSHVPAGLFRAANQLLDDEVLPDYEYYALIEPMRWFDLHLKDPFEFRLEPASLADKSICWFRSTAPEHLAKAWEIVKILEARDIFNIGGFSDQVFDLIAEFSRGQLNADHWVGVIEEVIL